MRFCGAARRYWLCVFPHVAWQLRRWQARAERIPNGRLRQLALEAQGKRANMEGAAIFAAFAPRAARRQAIAANVAFQSAYNYLDLLAEQPCRSPQRRGRALHQALLVAVSPERAHEGYYRHGPEGEDGGYLRSLVERCQASLAALPSYEVVRELVQQATERVVCFQSLNVVPSAGGHAQLAAWSQQTVAPGSGLAWWEAAGAAGSSLAIHALIAAAAEPDLDRAHAQTIHDAYHPCAGALHSLLDNLVDMREDVASAQVSLLAGYESPDAAAEGMRRLARAAACAMQRLPRHGEDHTLALAAVAGHYLASEEARAPIWREVREGLLSDLSPAARLAVLVFDLRRALSAALRVAAGHARPSADRARDPRPVRGVDAQPAPSAPAQVPPAPQQASSITDQREWHGARAA